LSEGENDNAPGAQPEASALQETPSLNEESVKNLPQASTFGNTGETAIEQAVVQVHNHFQAARTRTGKQLAGDLSIGKEHFYTWADAQNVPFCIIAKQRVYVVADVEEAIRRAGKISAPAPKAAPKKATTPKMTALEVAQAAGLRVVAKVGK
jgi:hypothetical protein